MAKTNIGKMPCETCGNHVTVKTNENGTLSYRCDECDAAPYAKSDTIQNKKWRDKLGVNNAPAAAQTAQKPVEAKAPKATPPMDTPKPQQKNNIWGI